MTPPPSGSDYEVAFRPRVKQIALLLADHQIDRAAAADEGEGLAARVVFGVGIGREGDYRPVLSPLSRGVTPGFTARQPPFALRGPLR